jgi:hypothetical protein
MTKEVAKKNGQVQPPFDDCSDLVGPISQESSRGEGALPQSYYREAHQNCIILKKNIKIFELLESLPAKIRQSYREKKSEFADESDVSIEAIILGSIIVVSYYLFKKRLFLRFMIGIPPMIYATFNLFKKLPAAIKNINEAVRLSGEIIKRDFPDVAQSKLKYPVALVIRTYLTLVRKS